VADGYVAGVIWEQLDNFAPALGYRICRKNFPSRARGSGHLNFLDAIADPDPPAATWCLDNVGAVQSHRLSRKFVGA
jgi:hypothetical protein